MASYPSFHFFNKFPSDIKRLIFEEAFEASNWDAVELAWVSREVRAWIEPLVYQGVATFKALPRAHRIRYNMLMNRIQGQQEPENRYTKYVQRLLVPDVHVATQLVPLCPNLKSLALTMPCTDENIPMLNALLVPNGFPFSNLRRLSIRWMMLPSEHRSCRHPIFQGLTHLETNIGWQSYWDGLSALTNLTNLRVNLRNTTFRNTGELLFVFRMVRETICPRCPTNLKYINILFRASHAADIASQAGARFSCDVETGRFDRRLLFDWSCLRVLYPIVPNALTRDWHDFVDSWIYLPRCYQDFWIREGLEIDNRNRVYGV